MPPRGTFQLQILGVTGAEKPLDGVRCSDSIGSVLQRLCAQSGAEPALTRLVFDNTVTLDDRGRTLEDYGIVQAAELHVTPMQPKTALPISLGVEATARLLAAVAACGTAEVLKLRNADGSHKHRRWVRLEEVDGTVFVIWSKNEDGSEQWQWKSFGSVAPKRRAVKGVREDRLGRASGLGLAIETVEGDDVLFVAESAAQRTKWLSALQEVVCAAALRSASEAAMDALVAVGCRSAGEVAALAVDEEALAALPGEAGGLVAHLVGRELGPGRKHLGMFGQFCTMSTATLGALLAAGCRSWWDVCSLSAEAAAGIADGAAQEVAKYVLRGRICDGGLGVRAEVVSDETLFFLFRAGCRSKENVLSLSAEALAALPAAAAQEVGKYQLRDSLGIPARPLRAFAEDRGQEDRAFILSDDTLLCLLQAGCRKAADVRSLSPMAAAALPDHAAQETANYVLRGPLAVAPEVISDETLLCLFRTVMECRTKANVLSLSAEALAALPAAAAQEVAGYRLLQVAKRPEFVAAKAFSGPRPGTVFKLGRKGLGYYRDVE
eukprot:COSAG04_NODE_2832_length_3519_cov_1.756725_2_plen_551_part_00